MDISVVICTHNRARSLHRALTHLAAQTIETAEVEIIVIDNNCTDHTAEVVRGVAGSSRVPVRYQVETAQGISYARNTGWALARGSIVAFTDDDIQVEPDWLTRIAAAFALHPTIECVGGKVLPAWSSSRPGWLTRDHWAPLAILDYGDEPLFLDRDDPRCLVGANLAVRRGTLERLGGFSPTVQRVKDGIGSIEDHEFLIRLWNEGGRALYVPEIVVFAPVDPPRLHKRYHRRWHAGHGHFYALLRVPTMERSQSGHVLGVPAHLYRTFLHSAAAWLGRVLRGRLNEAFLYETRMHFVRGFVGTRGREHLLGARRRYRPRVVQAATAHERRSTEVH